MFIRTLRKYGDWSSDHSSWPGSTVKNALRCRTCLLQPDFHNLRWADDCIWLVMRVFAFCTRACITVMRGIMVSSCVSGHSQERGRHCPGLYIRIMWYSNQKDAASCLLQILDRIDELLTQTIYCVPLALLAIRDRVHCPFTSFPFPFEADMSEQWHRQEGDFV